MLAKHGLRDIEYSLRIGEATRVESRKSREEASDLNRFDPHGIIRKHASTIEQISDPRLGSAAELDVFLSKGRGADDVAAG